MGNIGWSGSGCAKLSKDDSLVTALFLEDTELVLLRSIYPMLAGTETPPYLEWLLISLQSLGVAAQRGQPIRGWTANLLNSAMQRANIQRVVGLDGTALLSFSSSRIGKELSWARWINHTVSFHGLQIRWEAILPECWCSQLQKCLRP